MADHRSKENQRRRYERQIEKHRGYEEEKELRRKTKHRRGRQGTPAAKSKHEAFDEDAERFEKIRRSDPVLPTGAKERRSGAASAGTPSDASSEAAASFGEDAPIVVSVARGRVSVHVDGRERTAELPPALAKVQQSGIAVGDRVELVTHPDGATHVVGVAPRRTVLSRPDPGHPERERVIAANLDAAVLVNSVKAPPFRPRWIDRVLVALERGGIEPIVCVNKVDRLDADERAEIDALLEPYRRLGIATLCTSAESGEGVEALARCLAGRTCAFTGHSGVGKSSLLNALDPDGHRETKATRDSDGRGRHTTVSSSLRELGDGTRVIDTPGVRAFGLWKIERRELRHWFAEFAEPSRACRFRDCLHVTEPECGVREAVERDEIAPRRYEAYRRILDTLE